MKIHTVETCQVCGNSRTEITTQAKKSGNASYGRADNAQNFKNLSTGIEGSMNMWGFAPMPL